MTRSQPTTAGLPSTPRPRRVLVLVYPEVDLQDLAGPVQVLHEASQQGGAYRLTFCAPWPRVRTAQGLALADLEPLPEPRAGDLVLVPGVSTATLDRLEVAPLAWLVTAAAFFSAIW